MLVTAFATSSYPLFVPALLQEFPWSRAEAAIPYSVAMIAWGIFQPIAGAQADLRGTRPVILVGIVLMGLGYVIMGFSSSLWLITLGFGLFVGTATAASGLIPFGLLISKWFTKVRRASGVGLMQAAMPAGPIVIAPALFFVISSYGWRAGVIALGVLVLAVTLPLAYLGVRDPAVPAGEKGADGAPAGWRESLGLLRLPALRNLFIARIACGMSALMIAHLPASAEEFGFSHHVGAYSLSVYGASAVVACFLGGLAADRWGRVPTLVATFVVRAIGTLALALLGLDSSIFYIAVALATGPIFATVAVNNVQVFELVGARRAGFILGLSLVLHQVAAAIGPMLAGLLFDWTGTYRVSFFALGVALLLATIPALRTGQEPAQTARATSYPAAEAG